MTLEFTQIRVKGRVVSRKGTPLGTNIIACIDSDCRYTYTDKDGRFSSDFLCYVRKERKPEARAIMSGRAVTKTVDGDEIDFGNIVVNIPPRILSFSIPRSANKGDTIELSVSASDEDSTSLNYNWYDAKGRLIGSGQSIRYRITNPSYICASVEDEENRESMCGFVNVYGARPTLYLTSVPDEMEENRYYPLTISVSDPDSSENELSFSFYSTYHIPVSYAYSPNPVIYVPEMSEDLTVTFYFSVCDELWNCERKEKTVRLKNIPVTPAVKLRTERTRAAVGERMLFTADAENAQIFVWDFGDGEKIHTNNAYVRKSFTRPGDFNVSVEAFSKDNISARDSVSVTIGEKPKIISFSASPTYGPRPLTVSFVIQTEGAESLFWDFGDGSAAVTRSPSTTHTYRSLGEKRVRITAQNIYGSVSSDIAAVKVLNRPPVLTSFSYSPTGGYLPLTVTFSATATDETGITRYVFTFGDGYQKTLSTSDQQVSVSHTYMIAGNFTASVTVHDDQGDTDTKNTSVTVLTPPECAKDKPKVYLHANPSSGKAPLNVQLVASASTMYHPIIKYDWDIDGDNTIDFSSPLGVTTYKFFTSKKVNVRAVNACGEYGESSTAITITRQFHSHDFFTPISTCILPPIPNDNTFAIGDFNGDGKKDIVVSIYNWSAGYDSYFRILTGRGDGTFQEGLSYNSGLGGMPAILVFTVADVDSDGRQDIITTLLDGISYIKVFKNQGDGMFSQLSAVELPSSCHVFHLSAEADFNSDGKVDLFIGCSDRINSSSYVAYGDGTSFPNFISIPGVIGRTPDAAMADFNGDGRPDVAGVEADSGYFYVATNTGGVFVVSFTRPVTNVDRIEAGDFDADGKPDILVYGGDTASPESMLYLFTNRSTPSEMSFQLSATANAFISSSANGREVRVADLNSDGLPDYLFTAYAYVSPVPYFNLGLSLDQDFPKATSSYASPVIDSGFIGAMASPRIEVADFTSDSFEDVLLIHQNGCVVVFKRKAHFPAPKLVKMTPKGERQHYGCSAFQFVIAGAPIVFFALTRRKKFMLV